MSCVVHRSVFDLTDRQRERRGCETRSNQPMRWTFDSMAADPQPGPLGTDSPSQWSQCSPVRCGGLSVPHAYSLLHHCSLPSTGARFTPLFPSLRAAAAAGSERSRESEQRIASQCPRSDRIDQRVRHSNRHVAAARQRRRLAREQTRALATSTQLQQERLRLRRSKADGAGERRQHRWRRRRGAGAPPPSATHSRRFDARPLVRLRSHAATRSAGRRDGGRTRAARVRLGGVACPSRPKRAIGASAGAEG